MSELEVKNLMEDRILNFFCNQVDAMAALYPDYLEYISELHQIVAPARLALVLEALEPEAEERQAARADAAIAGVKAWRISEGASRL